MKNYQHNNGRFVKSVAGALSLLVASTMSSSILAQQVSPILVGNNLWYANEDTGATPSETVWQQTKDMNTKLIRIGGHQFDEDMPSNEIMEQWILKIRATGAEPLVQVSQYNYATPLNDRVAAAVSMVQYLNVTKKLNVKYWNIGNEPWLQAGKPADNAALAAMVSGYIKPISIAMKAVDPTIKIFGPDEAYFMNYLGEMFNSGTANDIGGKIPGKDYYYVDGVSWHSYPQDAGIDPAIQGAASFLNSIRNSKALVDAANIRHNRTGANALQWGIGEYNSKDGTVVHTYENGQMFGQILGYAMKYQATYAATWSMFENDGRRSGSDFSMIDGNGTPRSSYHHMAFVSKFMSGTYVDGVSTNTNVVAYGTVNGTQRTVMVMNRGTTAQNFTLRLNNDAIASTDVKININANSTQQYSSNIGANTTLLLVFSGESLRKFTYSKAHFASGMSPIEEVIDTSGGGSNGSTALINGEFTGSANGWSIYSFEPTGDVRDVRYENNSVRFYTDSTELNWHGQLYQKIDTVAGNTYSFACDVATTGTNATKVQLFIEEDVDLTNIVTSTCDVAGDGSTRCTATAKVPVGADNYDSKFGVRLANTADNPGWDFTVDNCALTVTAASSSAASSTPASSVPASSRSSIAASSIPASSTPASSRPASSIAASSVPASSTPASSIPASSKSSAASSLAASSLASSTAANNCQYVVTNQWNNGFTADIRITNNRTTAINGWNVSWSYSDGSRMTNSWNANTAGSNPYSASNLSWNSTIQPGQTVIFGFQGTKGSGAAAVPQVSGIACQ